jgi:O-phospho-L-seryl-tRNASec:L-selenocysteinyl-tRNA synthase
VRAWRSRADARVAPRQREARVFSNLVKQRHFHLGHGVGRSGDVAATQPKAAGSSVMARLTQSLVKDALRKGCNLRALPHVVVLPVATGMALSLCFLALKPPRGKNKVVWPRMDQKTCIKAMLTVGLEPVVIENVLDGDSVRCDLDAIGLALQDEQVGMVVTTTSCFAPRIPDNVVAVAQMCKARSIVHVINNAYGLQCSKCSHLIQEACRVGRVDAVVQSTDKNFMVPVGGSIVASPSEDVVRRVAKSYPGRASASPALDVFITLLQMGQTGYLELLRRRAQLANGAFRDMVRRVAAKHGERLLETPRNTISFAVTLSANVVDVQPGVEAAAEGLTAFGSMLFSRGVSGARVVPRNVRENIEGLELQGFGSSCAAYPTAYFTVACALGVEEKDLALIEERLDSTFKDFKARHGGGQL